MRLITSYVRDETLPVRLKETPAAFLSRDVELIDIEMCSWPCCLRADDPEFKCYKNVPIQACIWKSSMAIP